MKSKFKPYVTILAFATFLIFNLTSCTKEDPDPRNAWVGTWNGIAEVDTEIPACYTAQTGQVSFTGATSFKVDIVASATNKAQLNITVKSTPSTAWSIFNNYGFQTTGILASGSATFESYAPPGGQIWTFQIPSKIRPDGKLEFNGILVQPACVENIIHSFSGLLTRQ